MRPSGNTTLFGSCADSLTCMLLVMIPLRKTRFWWCWEVSICACCVTWQHSVDAAVDSDVCLLANVLVGIPQRYLLPADLNLKNHLFFHKTLSPWLSSNCKSRTNIRGTGARMSSTHTSLTPGASCLDRTNLPGFQSGASSATNFGRYH
jgi:hypothetical protein